jgi:hypothetical protein
MVERWIHLTELGGVPWVLPIWASVHDAMQKGKVKEISNELSEQGVYISARLNFLPRIVDRINSEVMALIEAVKTHKPEHEFSENCEGVAFAINDDLKYHILIDIDSLLFELNSLCELMCKFFAGLHVLAGKPMPKTSSGLSIKSILYKANQDSLWFVALDTHRNFFLHEGAPYVSVDISPSLNSFDVLVMKENIKSFGDESKFLRLSDIDKIVKGFSTYKPVIQKYLIELFYI